MKTKHLNWLLIAAFLVCYIPWQGKRLAPALFGSIYIQWPATGLTALLLPLGFLLSGHALVTRPAERRKTGWICIGFLFLFCCVLGISSLAGPMMDRVSRSFAAFSSQEALPRLMNKLETAPTEEKKQFIAQAIYIICGAAVPYRKDDGVFIVYQPTEKDKISWLESQDINTKLQDSRKLLDWQATQLLYITAAYITSFFLICLGSILVLIYRRSP